MNIHKKLKIFKTKKVKSPERIGLNAGIDFFVPDDFSEQNLHQGELISIPSGIKVRIPHGHALIALNKSGIITKKRLQIGACVIDENYMGEIHLSLYNTGSKTVVISPGDKIVQFLLVPVNYVDIQIYIDEEKMYKGLNKEERGKSGFGSTGK